MRIIDIAEYAVKRAGQDDMPDAARQVLDQTQNPLVSGLLGALVGGAGGAGVQAVRRGMSDEDEKDKPSVLSGALLGALGGGAAGYTHGADQFRTNVLDRFVAGTSTNPIMQALAQKLVQHGRPSFSQAAPSTFNPLQTNEGRLKALLEMTRGNVFGNAAP